jgi:transposase InsO family protein
VLGVTTGGFYAWRRSSAKPEALSDERLLGLIRKIFQEFEGNYGSPRIHRELVRKHKLRVSERRVARLMREHGIFVPTKRKFCVTTDGNHGEPLCENILKRNFTTEEPDVAWVTDVTYVPTGEGWLYVAVVLDLFSRRVVGWAASAENNTALARSALDRAVANRAPTEGTIHHSDRGSVYASRAYRGELSARGIVQSMSRKGDCWDNAVAESFFGSMKRECVNKHRFRTRADAVRVIGDYIDGFYNVRRRHSTLNYVSPIEFELQFKKTELERQAA